MSGDIKNSKENAPSYFVRTNPNGSLYDVPVVVDGTDYYEHDYRYGFGIRKIARFDYERKAMLLLQKAEKGELDTVEVEIERIRK